MSDWRIGRRAFLERAAAVAAAGALGVVAARAQEVVPNSAGTDRPKLKAPPNACDCHHHIYDPRFPFATPGARMVPNALVADYRRLQRRIGTTRNVIVTPAPFPASVADNQVTIDALAQFGGNARGVAIISPAMTATDLKMLHDRGFRGIRFSVATAGNAPGLLEMIEPMAKRVEPLGWHVQLNMTADQIVANEGLWNRLPNTLVFDHMGHMPQPEGAAHQAFATVRRLIDKGRTWVKLSVTYDSSKVGPPTYADVNKVGAAYVKAAPQRMVWGSNWPHPNETEKPDDARFLDLLLEWAPSETTRRRILVENPEALYGFPPSA